MVTFQSIFSFQRGVLYALLKDAYAFDGCWQKRFEQDWRKCDEFFFEHPHIADRCCFITVLDRTPIGFACWDPRPAPQFVELGHNCIASPYKGRGYGSQQLKEAVRRISQYEAPDKIMVTTNERLQPAVHNYERAGFILNGRTPSSDFFGDYLHYVLTLKF